MSFQTLKDPFVIELKTAINTAQKLLDFYECLNKTVTAPFSKGNLQQSVLSSSKSSAQTEIETGVNNLKTLVAALAAPTL